MRYRNLMAAMALLAVAASLCFMLADASEDSEADTVSTGTVTFEPNFPSGYSGTGSAKTYRLVAGNIELPTKLFTCNGHVLTGWGTSKAGGIVQWDSYNVKAGSATLYAQWTEIGSGLSFKLMDESAPKTGSKNELYTHAVHYGDKEDKAGGLLFEAGAATHGIELGPSTPAWLSAKMVVRVGYGEISFSGSPNEPGNYLVHCYVKGRMDISSVFWTINVPADTDAVHTVTFDLNGGTGTEPNSLQGIRGQAAVLPGSFASSVATEITNPGYELGGWDVPDEFGIASTYPLNSIYAIGRTLTAKAHWVAESNVVIFSLDGGSLENVDAYVVDFQENFTMPGDSKLTGTGGTKEGHTLIGWRETGRPDASFAPGFVKKVDGKMKLEAWFVPDTQLSSLKTVTFNYQGGTGPVNSQKVPAGKFVYLPGDGIEKKGAMFAGWSMTEGGTAINGDFVPVDGNVTLYALWKTTTPGTDTKWTVVFDSAGGNTSVPNQYVYDGTLAYRPGGVTKEGHVLTGWWSDILNREWDFFQDRVTQHMVLRAQWSEHFVYKVSGLTVTVTVRSPYDAMAEINWGDGTQNDKTTSGSAKHTYGDIHASDRIVVTSEVGSTKYTSTLPLSGLVGPHIPKVNNYVVIFDTNGGEPDTWRTEVDHGAVVEKPADPRREGHSFIGWYSLGELYDFSAPVEYNLYLLAKWKDGGGSIAPDVDDDPVIPTARARAVWDAEKRQWTLDGSGSVDALRLQWTLIAGGKRIAVGTGETVVLTEKDVQNLAEKPGTYKVELTVTSKTNHKDTDYVEITLEGEEPTPVEIDMWVLVAGGVVAVFGLFIATRYAL